MDFADPLGLPGVSGHDAGPFGHKCQEKKFTAKP